MNIQKTAPICLFVYNRLDHSKKTIDALKQNLFAQESDLIVYSDAAKTESNAEKVRGVRQYIREIKGFKSISIVERESNFGLANSIIDGVTKIVNEYGRVIILEDDIVTSPNFLKFMNDALDFYENNNKVGSVTGFSLPVFIPKDYTYQVYLTHRHSSWGWGTYKRVWNNIDWNVSDYEDFKKNKVVRSKFNIAGMDMALMLDKQMRAEINSWSIRFDYHCFKENLYSVSPVLGLVENIGFDGSGVHCGVDSTGLQGRVNFSHDRVIFPEELEFNKHIVRSSYRLFNYSVLLRIRILVKSLITWLNKLFR